mgnify:FL=1
MQDIAKIGFLYMSTQDILLFNLKRKKMKSNKLFKSLLFMFCCLSTLALVSCDNDDNDPVPSNAKEVLGDYTGTITVNSNKESVGVNINKTVAISAFPIKEIVTAVVDKTHQEEALKSLKETPYSMDYNASATDKAIALSLTPKELDFDMTVGGKSQKVKVTFASSATGSYVIADKALALTLKAESISIDGTKVSPFTAIDFVLAAKKK